MSRPIRQSWQIICEPLSEPVRMCISSIMTKRRSPNILTMSFERFISMLSSDSGVICSMPDGSFNSFAFCDCATSPCQCVTFMPLSSSSSFMRSNWSFIRLLSGAT